MAECIQSVRYYACGYCVNDLHTVFRHQPHERRSFPAGVFFIRHEKVGHILFDTGYSRDIYRLGWKGSLYRALNPTFVYPADEIQSQLRQDGISPADVRYLILSHLHPDHIGGVKAFPGAKILLSADAFRRYQQCRMKDLIFRKLLPPWFAAHCRILTDSQLGAERNQYGGYCDLFGDGSLKLMQLDGHAKGQLGCLIADQLFLAADASWGEAFVGRAAELRLPAQLVQDNVADYLRNDALLKRMRADGIRLCFSHDTSFRKELL